MSLSATFEQPALDQLIRHARLFGTECVYETGEQEGLSSADLARLRIELDELEAGRKSKHGFSIGKRRRRSSDETREAALALSVDGFVPKAIADKLGISDRTVRSYLKQSGATAYEGVRDLPKKKRPDFWLNQAADLAVKRHPRGIPIPGLWATVNRVPRCYGSCVEGHPDSIAVPVVWSSPEDVPILYANTFICQFEQTLDSFILTVGQLTPPALIAATPEELREQAENISFVVVKPVARFGLTRSRMEELAAMLQANLDQLERATTMRPGDPR